MKGNIMDTQERLKIASIKKEEGYNCCQCVILACADMVGMNDDAAYAGFCFGAGMNCGSICGALTGGLMVLGAALPRQDVMENRPLARAAALELEKRFHEKFGTLECKDIIRQHEKKMCGDCIAFATEQAEDIIKSIKKGEFRYETV